MTVYAIERANIDIILFLLTIAAGLLSLRASPLRLLSYPIIALASLLKFYPVVLLIVALRERPRIFLMVTIAAIATGSAFIAYFHVELAAAAASPYSGSYFTDLFGAKNLPNGIAIFAAQRLSPGSPAEALVSRYLPPAFGALLVLVMARRVLAAAARPDLQAMIAALPARDAMFLTLGAALICGCFFAGQNVGYRGVYFLFVLPGLLTRWRGAARPGQRRLFMSASLLVVLLMWEECFRHAIGALAPDIVARMWWLLRELAWWYMAGLLTAILLCVVRCSAMARQLPARVRRYVAT
jgi:hypothetical protein